MNGHAAEPAYSLASLRRASQPMPPRLQGGQWLHARKDGQRVRLYSRPGNDLTYRFPLIVEALAKLRSRSASAKALDLTVRSTPPLLRGQGRRAPPFGQIDGLA
jgi:hypothetical protein